MYVYVERLRRVEETANKRINSLQLELTSLQAKMNEMANLYDLEKGETVGLRKELSDLHISQLQQGIYT